MNINYLPKHENEINMELLGTGDSFSDDMIKDGIIALIKASAETGIDLWRFINEYIPPNGYMFSSNHLISIISKHMTIGHSGTSYGWTMRQLERIAKFGCRSNLNNERTWLHESDIEEGECAVCYQNNKKVITPCCKNIFCKICIETWLSKQTTCPLCRKNI